MNVAATMRALEVSVAQVNFAACKLFTDAPVTAHHPDITVIPITRLGSTQAYSDFLLSQMVDHLETSHCLVVQWDGHVLDTRRWRHDFLNYDYIGARWPQFADGHDVGNGGFSLRSRRLMEACREPQFLACHLEDIAIARLNRTWLEGKGLRFASGALADLFATERAGDLETSFGYHGVWHMPRTIGVEAFWQVYRDLDDRSTIKRDFMAILKIVGRGAGGASRMGRMILDLAKQF
ncbi:DUF5672 family protein [Sphingobium sp. CECT 9361]|uniref:DUF5672 family protein n=1 Tax=Sphingobium sp. CECT 9361 TaxID=2845384 RepID=UPI0033B528A0